MDKSQIKKIAIQLSFLGVLIVAIFIMLGGGFSGGGDATENTPESVTQRLNLPEVPDIPDSFEGTLKVVEQEFSRRDIKNIEIEEFNGPNRNIFRPAN